jgi:hypothetical protein
MVGMTGKNHHGGRSVRWRNFFMAERSTERQEGTRIPPKNPPPVTYFLQLHL